MGCSISSLALRRSNQEEVKQMQRPAQPPDETERLIELRELGLLDTPPEQRFDRISRLLLRLFNAPIAFVALVDANRQWFKSCYGLNVSGTQREVSFC